MSPAPERRAAINANTTFLTPHCLERITEIYGDLPEKDNYDLLNKSKPISSHDVMLLVDRPDDGEYTWSLETRFLLDPNTWGIFVIENKRWNDKVQPFVAVTYLRIPPRLREMWIWMSRYFFPGLT